VAADKVNVSQAQTNLKDAVLTSPVAGTVVTLDISPGQSVSAGSTTVGSGSSASSSSSGTSSTSSSSSSSSEVLIEPLNTFVVDVDASTSQLSELEMGEQATITPTGTSTTAYGVVTSVSQLGTTSSGVTTFPVTITVTGSPKGLYSGASTDVSIVVSEVTNVLVVPTTAVHAIGTGSYVDVLKNGKETVQAVTTGSASGEYTQIKSGLKSGQEVVIASLSRSATTGSGTTGRAGFGGFGGGGFGGGGGGFGGGGGGAFFSRGAGGGLGG
jgi:macrolide-specific efflux system membrane fusion protein